MEVLPHGGGKFNISNFHLHDLADTVDKDTFSLGFSKVSNAGGIKRLRGNQCFN